MQVEIAVGLMWVVILTLMYGAGRIAEMVFFYTVATAYASYVFVQRVHSPMAAAQDLATLYVVYAAIGFVVTFVWHFFFSLSVKDKYDRLLASEDFQDTVKRIVHLSDKVLNADSYATDSVAVSEKLKIWMQEVSESDTHPDRRKLFRLNAMCHSLEKSDIRHELFRYGPTMRIINWVDFKTNAALSHNCFVLEGGFALYTPDNCQAAISEVVPPKIKTVKKVLIYVWLFWPMVLTWLVFYKLASKVASFAVTRLSKLYDRIATKLFGEI